MASFFDLIGRKTFSVPNGGPNAGASRAGGAVPFDEVVG